MIVAKMLAKAPTDRYSNFLDVAQDLVWVQEGKTDRILGQKTVTTKTVKNAASQKSNKLLAIIASCCVGCTGVAAFTFFINSKQSFTRSADTPNELKDRPTASNTIAEVEDINSPIVRPDVEDGAFCHAIGNQRYFLFPTHDNLGSISWWKTDHQSVSFDAMSKVDLAPEAQPICQTLNFFAQAEPTQPHQFWKNWPTTIRLQHSAY